MEIEQKALIDTLTYTTEIILNLTNKLNILENKFNALEKILINIKDNLRSNNTSKMITKINELENKLSLATKKNDTHNLIINKDTCNDNIIIDNENIDDESENNSSKNMSDPTTINPELYNNLNKKKGKVLVNTLIQKRIDIINKLNNNNNCHTNIIKPEIVSNPKLINKRRGRRF